MEEGLEDFMIDRMHLRDLTQVMAIENYSFPTPWKRSMYEQDLTENPHSRFFTVKRKSTAELAAYSGTWFIYEEAHVGTIATRSDYRGLRLGEQLLAYTALQAQMESMKYMILEVRVGNLSAIRLYERLGFSTVGLRRGYYSDTGEDALLMTADNLGAIAARLKIDEA